MMLLSEKVITEAKPYFKVKRRVSSAIDAITMDQDAVVYNDDGTITPEIHKIMCLTNEHFRKDGRSCMKNFVITVARGFGSGGRDIAAMLC